MQQNNFRNNDIQAPNRENRWMLHGISDVSGGWRLRWGWARRCSRVTGSPGPGPIL